MRKYYISVKGTLIPFRIKREDFSKVAPCNTDTLVRFNSKGIATVDKKADELYAYYAGAHECICMGCYKNLAPKVKNEEDRCGTIDIMLMEQMPVEYREVYRQKRIKMFETLIANDLSPSRNRLFKNSIKILKNTRVD